MMTEILLLWSLVIFAHGSYVRDLHDEINKFLHAGHTAMQPGSRVERAIHFCLGLHACLGRLGTLDQHEIAAQ